MSFVARVAILSLLLLFAQQAPAVQPVTGATPWAVILCKFKDRAQEPFQAKDIEPFFSEAGAGTGAMFDFWKDMSFGNIDLTGSKAFGWFEIPYTLKDYSELGGQQPAGRDKKIAACLGSAKGVSINGFYGVVVIWNDDGGQFWGGPGQVALTPGSLFPSPVGEEMGHGYGVINHPFNARLQEYGDPWDVMSWANVASFNDPVRGQSGPGLSTSHRALLGWLDPARVTDIAKGSKATVRLDSLSHGTGSDMLMARASTSATDHFDVELRMRHGWDRGIGGSGVLVRKVDSGLRVILQGDPGFENLQAGGRFLDAGSDIQVRVLAFDQFAAQADVEIGPTGPSATPHNNPLPNARGWNNTDVEVLVSAAHRAPRSGVPLITMKATGAQTTPVSTRPGFSTFIIVRNEGVTTVNYSAVDGNGNGNVGDAGSVRVAIDKTPPVSSVTLVPTAAGFEARIVASDALSGVKEIRYSLNPFGPDQVAPGNQKTVQLPVSGWSTLLYWAVDEAGNVEFPYKQLTIGPRLEVSPPQLNLVAPVNAFGAPAFVTLRNSGVATINIDWVSTDTALFRAKPGATCIGPLAGGATCQLGVEFYALAPFGYDGTLYIGTNDFHQLQFNVALHGEGKLPGLTFNPDPVVFAPVIVGTIGSAFARVFVTNNSGVPVTITNINTGASVYQIFLDQCGPKPFTLATGAACPVDLLFYPTGYGLHPGALQVVANVPGGSQYVSLQGMGIVVPQLTATPNPMDFRTIPVGEIREIKVTIRNNGSAPVFIQNFSIAGANPAMFVVRRAACQNGVPPVSVEPQQACGMTVVYFPAATGSHQAVLRANLANGLGPFDVPLLGSAP